MTLPAQVERARDQRVRAERRLLGATSARAGRWSAHAWIVTFRDAVADVLLEEEAALILRQAARGAAGLEDYAADVARRSARAHELGCGCTSEAADPTCRRQWDSAVAEVVQAVREFLLPLLEDAERTDATPLVRRELVRFAAELEAAADRPDDGPPPAPPDAIADPLARPARTGQSPGARLTRPAGAKGGSSTA